MVFHVFTGKNSGVVTQTYIQVYDPATDIASVNNKVSVDLFYCLSSLFVVNMIQKLCNPLMYCSKNTGHWYS